MFSITKVWNWLVACQQLNWLMNWCVLYIHTVELRPVLGKNTVLVFAGKWIELEVIVLSDIRQTHTDK